MSRPVQAWRLTIFPTRCASRVLPPHIQSTSRHLLDARGIVARATLPSCASLVTSNYFSTDCFIYSLSFVWLDPGAWFRPNHGEISENQRRPRHRDIPTIRSAHSIRRRRSRTAYM